MKKTKLKHIIIPGILCALTMARLTSMSITIKIVFLTLLVCCQGALLGSLEYTLISILILLSFALGLYIFLSEYLLYRYDAQDRPEESED